MLLGRPLALTVGATLLILLLWRRVNSARPSSTLLLVTTSLLAASAWVHGSWYLFGLVVAAFGLAGQRKAALWLGGCWLAGSFAGAFLTGHPIAFLTNAIRIALNCFSGNTLQRFLAFEFLPSDGNIAILFAVGGLLLWRYATGHWDRACVNDPVFLLGVLGWMLGLRVSRFYADWGAPALLLWMALELSEHAERLLAYHSLKRFIVSAALAFSLLFAVTADTNGRWTNSLFIEFLSEADTEMKPWLPEDGGVLYSSDMTVFYQTFFKNPDAKWRYMLGFEPTFMPPDDLRIYRNFQMNLGSYKAYEPWIAKMGLRDRLVVRSGSPAAPGIPGLEWHYAARELWIGRKARLQVEPGDSTSQPRGIKADR